MNSSVNSLPSTSLPDERSNVNNTNYSITVPSNGILPVYTVNLSGKTPQVHKRLLKFPPNAIAIPRV